MQRGFVRDTDFIGSITLLNCDLKRDKKSYLLSIEVCIIMVQTFHRIVKVVADLAEYMDGVCTSFLVDADICEEALTKT